VKGGGTIRGLFSLPTTGTATTNTGFNSQPMDLAASAFNSSTSTPVTQTFQWQAEPVGNNTSSASGSLNLLFAEGSGKFAETGFQIDSNGQITFATGQSGSGLGNVDASELGGLAASAFAQLAAANTFTANQTVNGNVSVVGGNISVGGSRALSCTLACGAIGTVTNGSITYYGLGTVAAPAGYSLTGCSAYWASSTTCGTIQYPATANITALADAAGACHALGYNGSGGTLVSCACATACELP